MKKNLEYKVLKRLSANDNGEYVDITNLFKNQTESHRVLKQMRESGHIDYFTRNGEKQMALIKYKGLLYMESLRPNLSLYQKIYLSLFIIFGVLGLLSGFVLSPSNSEFQTLKNDFLDLKNQLSPLNETNKSYNTTIKKSQNDTLQTKNYHD
ncbi:hypothetical protein [Formosa sp. 4Alg 33]|uniref:hypothetical protein n=1 Tax=Formosa sp. 4Alg 33 TaxID=3382189 RepID=UPI003D9C44D0